MLHPRPSGSKFLRAGMFGGDKQSAPFPAVPSIIHPSSAQLNFFAGRRQHAIMIRSFLYSLISAFRTRRSPALENLALRQQLAVLHRSVKRPRLSESDRGFWVLLRRIWTDWERILVIVKP